jgi:hypothetical protein
MPAPSRLQIATSSLERLLKEEASYHKELEQGEARIRTAEQQNSSDENADYMIRQEVLLFHFPYLLHTDVVAEEGRGRDKGCFPITPSTH